MILLDRVKSIYVPQMKNSLFYLIDLHSPRNEEVEEARCLLDDKSLYEAQRFVFREHRERSIIVKAVLRLVISNVVNEPINKIEFQRNQLGKPFLKNQSLYFSLSHSNRYALFGLHPRLPVGVDVEMIRDDLNFLKIADLFMHPKEKELLHISRNPEKFFFTLWCAKEALLKSLDIHFNRLKEIFLKGSLDSFCFEFDGNIICVRENKRSKYMFAFCGQ